MRKPFVQTAFSHLHLQRPTQVVEPGIEQDVVLGTSEIFRHPTIFGVENQ